MSKVKQLDKESLREILDEVNEELRALGKQFGVELKAGGGKFTPTNATVKLQVNLIHKGEVIRKEATDWNRYYRSFGFKKDQLNSEIKWHGERWIVRGLLMRARKNPILAERKRDGKMYRLSEMALTGKYVRDGSY
jgi:hypothetical protein